MNNQELVKEAIEDSNTLSSFQKKILKVQTEKLFEQAYQERDLIKTIRKCLYKGDLINIYNHFRLDHQYVIIEVDNEFKDSGDRMFRTIDMIKKSSVINCSFDLETQILITLGLKYDGSNSQFANFACKMLGKTNENQDGK